MAIMLTRETHRSRERRVGAVNETGLYSTAAHALTGSSAYWRGVVDYIESVEDDQPVHASFYKVERVEEDERPVVTMAFMEAPPDDTDW